MMTDWKEKILEATDKAIAVIRKKGNKFCIYSKTGKNLGCYKTKKEAENRLSQIEMWKHMKDN
jgi:hypothetical protein